MEITLFTRESYRPTHAIIAKFHYTDTDTDPTRTRPDPHGLFLRRNSVGSVRVRVVEFSFYVTQ